MTIAIEPVPAFPSEATQLRVDDGHVIFNQSINCQYALLDADGNLVSVPKRNTLTTEQYEAWTGDDEFVAQCVAENIGLTPIIS
jgi:hypothetical protein